MNIEHAGGMLLAHLCRALPIDLENDIDAQSQLLVYPSFRGAVKIAIDLGAFEKLLDWRIALKASLSMK
jgi:hypothetical protein